MLITQAEDQRARLLGWGHREEQGTWFQGKKSLDSNEADALENQAFLGWWLSRCDLEVSKDSCGSNLFS